MSRLDTKTKNSSRQASFYNKKGDAHVHTMDDGSNGANFSSVHSRQTARLVVTKKIHKAL